MVTCFDAVIIWPVSVWSFCLHIWECEKCVDTVVGIETQFLVFDFICDIVKLFAIKSSWGRTLNRIMKSLCNFTVDNYIDLHLFYVKSEDNPADFHSRRLSTLGFMLTGEKFGIWSTVSLSSAPWFKLYD